jgi:hypothetical protein
MGERRGLIPSSGRIDSKPCPLDEAAKAKGTSPISQRDVMAWFSWAIHGTPVEHEPPRNPNKSRVRPPGRTMQDRVGGGARARGSFRDGRWPKAMAQGTRTIEPVVRRFSRSSWARAASASG